MSLHCALPFLDASFWGGDLEGFIFQAAPRGVCAEKKVILTVGGTAVYRLGKKMPDGVILGARGPYGILVRDRDTALNRWFIETYFQRYGGYPSEAAYQYAQALLATKIAYARAAAAAGRFPGQAQVIAAFEGLEFEGFPTPGRKTPAAGNQEVAG